MANQISQIVNLKSYDVKSLFSEIKSEQLDLDFILQELDLDIDLEESYEVTTLLVYHSMQIT